MNSNATLNTNRDAASSNIITWLTPSETCGCFLCYHKRRIVTDSSSRRENIQTWGGRKWNDLYHRFISGHKCFFKKHLVPEEKNWHCMFVKDARCHIQRSRRWRQKLPSQRRASETEVQYLFEATGHFLQDIFQPEPGLYTETMIFTS